MPQDIYPFFKQAHIFVLPSLREGIPVAAMEAMAMGLPVITTNIYGIPELVENGKEGLLVEPGNAKALAEAIESLAADRELMREMGISGRAKIEREFNIQRNVAQLYSLFFNITRNEGL